MKKNLIKLGCLILIQLCFLEIISAQESSKFSVIPCQTEVDVVNIIDTILLKGLSEKGLVSNIRFKKGDPQMVGRFYDGDAMSFESGIVFSTGLVNMVKGPNSSGATSKDMKLEGDSDLSKLTGSALKSLDAVVVEFDFIPISGSFSFDYFFASEEYNRYVDSGFNDVFGFFLSGEEVEGDFSDNAKNIALMPDGTYVGINSVNCGQEAEYMNPPPGMGPYCEYLIWNNHFSSSAADAAYCQFNAFTKPLKAQSDVISCEKYHIKLAISDVQDGSYDSGVFFKAGSFDLGGVKVEQTSLRPEIGNLVIKDCNEVTVHFKTNEIREHDISFPIMYGGDVLMGEDTPFLPASLTIPKGKDNVSFVVKALNGDFFKPKKLMVAYPKNLCLMNDLQQDTVYIHPVKQVLAKNIPEKISIECDEEIVLKAQPHGGYEPYEIEWNQNGESQSGDDFQFVPYSSGRIRLKVKDACSSVYADSSLVEIGGLSLDCGPDLEVCHGRSVRLEAETNGEVVYWNDGSMENYVVPRIKKDTLVWCRGKNNCGMWLTDTVSLGAILPDADAGLDSLICPNNEIMLTANDASSWSWSTGQSTQSILVQPEENTAYYLEIEDFCGNTDRDTVVITIKDDEFAFAGNDSLVCKGTEILLNGKGGEKVEWMHNTNLISNQRKFPFIINQDMEFILNTLDYCKSIDTVKYTVEKFPDYNFEYKQIEGCPPLENLIINNTPDSDLLSWEWSNNNEVLGVGEDFNYVFQNPGEVNIKVVAESKLGCKDSTIVVNVVTVFPVPEMKILPRKINYTMGKKKYTFFPDEDKREWEYVWEMNGEILGHDKDLQLSFSEEKDWIIKLTTKNTYGCEFLDSIRIVSLDNSTRIIVPNAFSPNNDGLNDQFEISHRSVRQFALKIFNRWGELVFETTDPDFSWNAYSKKGNLVPSGSYVFLIDYLSLEGLKKQSKGLLYVVY